MHALLLIYTKFEVRSVTRYKDTMGPQNLENESCYPDHVHLRVRCHSRSGNWYGLCTKFDESRFSHSRDMIGAPCLKWVTWPWLQPLQRSFVICSWNLLWSTCVPNFKSLSPPVMKIGRTTQK